MTSALGYGRGGVGGSERGVGGWVEGWEVVCAGVEWVRVFGDEKLSPFHFRGAVTLLPYGLT